MSQLKSEYQDLGNGCFEFVPADDVQPLTEAETIKLLEGFGYHVMPGSREPIEVDSGKS